MMRYSSVGLLSLLFLTTVNISGVPTSPQPQHKQTCNTIDKQNPINSETKNLRASPPLMVKNFITVNSQSLPNISAVPLSPVGAMGTTQYIIGTNDGIRSYSRATGVADQALNSSLTAFFQLSSIPAGIEIGVQIKFDRFSNRWFVLGAADPFVGPFPMTLFLATSNSDVITSCSTWSISTIVVDPSGNNFINEVPSLGIDSNAVYIGINLYNNNTGNFTGSNAYVLPKNTNLYAGTPDVYTFTNVGTPTGGMFTPIGVDNFDTDPEFGYFVGVDVVDLSSMVLHVCLCCG